MDNLRRSLRVLFLDFCSDYVLFQKDYYKYINIDKFIEIGFNTFGSYSLDEIQNVFFKLDTDWFYDINQFKVKNLFNLLNHFTTQVIVEQDLEPFIVFNHLLKWRDVSYFIGEDILSTSYFAQIDNRSQRKRDFFSWRGTAFSDNKRLRQILESGLAENHFHLKGSGPVFDLSWLNLMNNPNSFRDKFNLLEKELSLFTRRSNSSKSSKKELKVLVYKAAYIRFVLFCFVNNLESPNTLEIDLSKDSNIVDSYDLIMQLPQLVKLIETIRYDLGHRFLHRGNYEVLDYAIPKNIHPENLKKAYIYYGERLLLYNCFKLIYSNNKEFKKYIHLFHAYLLIKSQFRAELVQVNDKVGFGNFSKYQDRKEYFLPDDSLYHTAFMNLAVHDTKKNMNIESFELRVAPKNDFIRLRNSLSGYNNAVRKRAIQSEQKRRKETFKYSLKENNIFYTIHYIKKRDQQNYSDLASEIICRHNLLRKEIKDQSIAISKLRESYSNLSDLIRGIDAASSEFNAAPEVFAQGYRYLKNHKLKGKYNHLRKKLEEPKLYATFHAGEDFYDITDGLRAIDECIYFLNLKQGDRIGHALALGIDAKEYYAFKHYKLMLPKQTVLDNVSWLLAKIRKFGVGIHRNEVNRLEKIFENLYYEIFINNYDDSNLLKNKYISNTTYYDAWKLRGDDPYLYLNNLENVVYDEINYTYWDRCRINQNYPLNKNIRRNLDVKTIYQQYHFNNKIKRAGAEIKQFEISFEYIELVMCVQMKMQHVIKEKQIAIEANPTSNYLIGTFRRYAKHPVTKFFNLGLEVDQNIIKDCPQISVSINTDDQGIFSTSLENEYALLAIALQKERDKNGNPIYNSAMIYDWLDRLRQMGLEQSFNN